MFPCPCCGHLVFEEGPGSYDICPICNWEDDALQLQFATSLAGGANRLSLINAQREFATKAARLSHKHPDAQFPSEMDPAWRPIDPATDKFPHWRGTDIERASVLDESLYYWRTTFWTRRTAT